MWGLRCMRDRQFASGAGVLGEGLPLDQVAFEHDVVRGWWRRVVCAPRGWVAEGANSRNQAGTGRGDQARS